MLHSIPTWLARWLGIGADGAPAVRPAETSSAASTATPVEPSADAPEIPESWNATTAVELIARLMDLTSTVADEVGEHSGHIESINEELATVKSGDSAAVAAVVCKLLMVNQETQRRLEQAELKLQAQQRQLHDVSTAARMDGLTGLVNRRALDEAMQRALADFQRKGRLATMLLLDVDHFKEFNDTHGHVAGDEALKHLADVLRSQSRETDVVARFGGEEFVVIFTGASLGAVKQRAEKMRAAIQSRPVLLEGTEFRISASAGLAELVEGDNEQEWIRRADAALYAAKDNGRNCMYWHDGNQPLRLETRDDDSEQPTPAGAVHADRRRISSELAADSYSDPTFISALTRRIAEWRRGGATFSVVLARLDRMDQIVRQHGGDVLQTAVKALSQLARACLRDMDQPTRWQSDGLAILIPGARVGDAASAARRLMAAIERCELPVAGGNIHLSLSMGTAEVIDGNDAHRLLERAWLALDSARQAGGGQICLHDGLQSVLVPPQHVGAV